MKFTPKTEEEILASGLLKDGVYDFEVLTGEDTTSKKGNEMIKLSVRVFDHASGTAITVDDYLVDIPSMEYKIRHAAEASGLLDEYNKGFITGSDFVGRSGQLILGSQEGNLKDDGTRYRSKNVVKDYVKSLATEAKAPGQVDKELDDSIPF